MLDIQMIPVGGLYEFGNQCYLYGVRGEYIMVDCGSKFSSEIRNEKHIPDFQYVDGIKDKLKGILITHNHEDHLGAVLDVMKKYPSVPVFCSYYVQEQIIAKALKNPENQVSKSQIHPFFSNKKTKVSSCFSFEFLPVNHSVPNAGMLYIQTPAGNILHTGDWRYERNPLSFDMDMAKLQSLRGEVTALVADSTGILNETTLHLSESDVQKSLCNLTRRIIKPRKRLIFGCFSTHVERIDIIAKIAQGQKRTTYMVGRSMIENAKISEKCGLFQPKNVLCAESFEQANAIYIATGTQCEAGSALDRLSRSEPLNGETAIILSASAIPTEKKNVDKMVESFKEKGYTVYQNESNLLTHVSGHAPLNDIQMLIEMVQPQIYIPVHGEAEHLKKAEALGHSLSVPYVVRFNSCGEKASFSKWDEPKLEKLYTPQIIKRPDLLPFMRKGRQKTKS